MVTCQDLRNRARQSLLTRQHSLSIMPVCASVLGPVIAMLDDGALLPSSTPSSMPRPCRSSVAPRNVTELLLETEA